MNNFSSHFKRPKPFEEAVLAIKAIFTSTSLGRLGRCPTGARGLSARNDAKCRCIVQMEFEIPHWPCESRLGHGFLRDKY
jgi:hypothetical protein